MSYLGLVPRENSSEESQKRGHITKAGCTQTRALLVQAAQRILRLRNLVTEVLWIWAEGIAKRRPAERAKTRGSSSGEIPFPLFLTVISISWS